MTNDYRIEPAGTAFRVLDPCGEYLVDLFPTHEAAQRQEQFMSDFMQDQLAAAISGKREFSDTPYFGDSKVYAGE